LLETFETLVLGLDFLIILPVLMTFGISGFVRISFSKIEILSFAYVNSFKWTSSWSENSEGSLLVLRVWTSLVESERKDSCFVSFCSSESLRSVVNLLFSKLVDKFTNYACRLSASSSIYVNFVRHYETLSWLSSKVWSLLYIVVLSEFYWSTELNFYFNSLIVAKVVSANRGKSLIVYLFWRGFDFEQPMIERRLLCFIW